MNEPNEDIFFQVKRQILDKLDLILQKINIEIINYIKPHEDSFDFIQLSFFEEEITHLFGYLDRLYASLNSSVSFSSIQSYKESTEQYQVQNQRLSQENVKLKQMIEQISESSMGKQSSHKLISQQDLLMQMKIAYASALDPLKMKLKTINTQFTHLIKAVKKQLKNYRFQMLEMRIEIISKLKQWQGKVSSHEHQVFEPDQDRQCTDLEHYRGCEEILETINDILSIC